MDTATKPAPAKQTSFVVTPEPTTVPQSTTQRVVMRCIEDIPAEIQKRATADWHAQKDGADPIALRNLFNSQHESPQDRYDYGFVIARLRYPAPTRRESARNWQHGKLQRKAA